MMRVLLIEDDAADAALIERHLAQRIPGVMCHQVHRVEALDAALEEPLGWDVVLFDVQVPGLGLNDSARRVRRLLPHVPMILVSGTVGEERAVDLLHQGFDDFVLKDGMVRLVSALHRAIEAAGQRRARESAERASAQSQLRTQAIFEGISDAGIFTDLDRRIVMVNPAFTLQFGYLPEEVVGRTTEFLYADTADFRAVGTRVARPDQLGAGLREEHLYRRKGGSEFWAETLGVAIRDPDGGLLGLLGLHRDITDRKRQEARLNQAVAVFRAAQEGIVVLDVRRCILSVNPSFGLITGFAEADAIGIDLCELLAQANDADHMAAISDGLSGDGSWQGEVQLRRTDGLMATHWLSLSTVVDEHQQPSQYVGLFSDITRLKQSEARLERLAHYDPLTNLPNRLLLTERLQNAIDRCARRSQRVAVLYLDLDRFKTVNDSLGHPVGDELLLAMAQRLSGRLRAEDTLGRLGGDEFLVVLDDLGDANDAMTVARAMLALLEQPFLLDSGHEVFVGASVGVSIFPDDANTVTEMIQHADAAMYLAKDHGRNTVRFYTDALTRSANDRLTLETRLRRALERDEFFLNYQPLLGGDPPRPIGVEALVRCQPPGEAVVPPTRFIPIAEENGLIVPLGLWVLREACLQAKRWMDAGLPPVFMAVNMSGRQFQMQDVASQVREVLHETGLPPEQLELELTESVVMQQAEDSIAHLTALKALGVRVAIDDFGTGYSSLAYLKRFPIDKLKIDRSFVDGLGNDVDDQEIAATIIAMARGLRLHVVAEGVETREQLTFLMRHGCDQFQGYFFSKPQSADACAAFLSAWSPTPGDDVDAHAQLDAAVAAVTQDPEGVFRSPAPG